MTKFKKYFSIFVIYSKNTLSRDISFRLSFFMSLIGSFCFVLLNFFIVYFLMQKVNIGRWSYDEMIILLGNFYVLSYSIFLLFWRGFIHLVRDIRSGAFDYNLVRPVDSQFLVSLTGGGFHNLLSVIFGFFVIGWGIVNLGSGLNLIQIATWTITMLLSILACYSYILLIITLNFRYGYLEEVINLAFGFQDFAKYPIDAFSKLPFYLLFFAIPFSSLTTIPSIILIDTIFPTSKFLVFSAICIIFILFVRKVWVISLKNYTSSS